MRVFSVRRAISADTRIHHIPESSLRFAVGSAPLSHSVAVSRDSIEPFLDRDIEFSGRGRYDVLPPIGFLDVCSEILLSLIRKGIGGTISEEDDETTFAEFPCFLGEFLEVVFLVVLCAA